MALPTVDIFAKVNKSIQTFPFFWHVTNVKKRKSKCSANFRGDKGALDWRDKNYLEDEALKKERKTKRWPDFWSCSSQAITLKPFYQEKELESSTVVLIFSFLPARGVSGWRWRASINRYRRKFFTQERKLVCPRKPLFISLTWSFISSKP